jgi:hypothetical protein
VEGTYFSKKRGIGGVWEEYSVPFVLEKRRRERRRLRRRNLELPWRRREVFAMAAPVMLVWSWVLVPADA